MEHGSCIINLWRVVVGLCIDEHTLYVLPEVFRVQHVLLCRPDVLSDHREADRLALDYIEILLLGLLRHLLPERQQKVLFLVIGNQHLNNLL